MKNLPKPHRRANIKSYKAHFLPLFERTAKEPLVWALQADRLMRAASQLRPAIDSFHETIRTGNAGSGMPLGEGISAVCMMLYGFAAENLMKGILIARFPSRVGALKLLKWEGGGHDLLALAKAVGLNLKRDDKRLLLSLSVHAEWVGRYPCPINHEDRLPRPMSGGGFAPLGGIYGTDIGKAETLCKQFERLLQNQPRRIEPDI